MGSISWWMALAHGATACGFLSRRCRSGRLSGLCRKHREGEGDRLSLLEVFLDPPEAIFRSIARGRCICRGLLVLWRGGGARRCQAFTRRDGAGVTSRSAPLTQFLQVNGRVLGAWWRIGVRVAASSVCAPRGASGRVFQSAGKRALSGAYRVFRGHRRRSISRGTRRLAFAGSVSGGGTTTCDALWMGVPVVSLIGESAVGQAGYYSTHWGLRVWQSDEEVMCGGRWNGGRSCG